MLRTIVLYRRTAVLIYAQLALLLLVIAPPQATAGVRQHSSATQTTGITASTPRLTTSVTGARVDYSVTTAVRTTFAQIGVAVRPSAGGAPVLSSYARSVTVKGTKALSASFALSPGSYSADVRYTVDGLTWVTAASAPFTLTADSVAADVQHLSWFYRPPAGSLDAVAGSFDRYILTKLDEPTRESLKQKGETGPFLQYLRFDAIIDDTGLGYTFHNQVAWKPGDWTAISTNHPDWFLLDADGNRIRSNNSASTRAYLMDPANPEWRSFFLSRMTEMQTSFGWDGVFLDNVEASLAKRERNGQIPARYPTDVAYQAAVKDFLVYLNTNYFTPQQRPLEANVIELRSDDSAVWDDYLSQLSGAMREGWAIGWDDSRYPSETTWERALALAERTQAAGKQVTLVAVGTQANTARQQFAYASYLLIASGPASFRYASSDAYDQPWLYPNYTKNLGKPLGPRYKTGTTWRRDFVNGTVTVDPVTHTATIT